MKMINHLAPSPQTGRSKAKDVDSYIANSDKEARPILKEIRKIIKSTIPKVEEGISWGVPFYKYHGVLAGFATYKNHVSFGLAFVLQSKDREMLEKKGYITGKKTIQIKFDQKVPTTAIKQILKVKAKINEAKRTIK
jgi:uncharacterized protein